MVLNACFYIEKTINIKTNRETANSTKVDFSRHLPVSLV